MVDIAPPHWSTRIPPPPPLGWDELEEVLLSLTVQPFARLMIHSGLGAIGKTAPFKPRQMVWRELLILAWIVLGEAPVTMEPVESDGEAPMT